jgi:hypothetical protein
MLAFPGFRDWINTGAYFWTFLEALATALAVDVNPLAATLRHEPDPT